VSGRYIMAAVVLFALALGFGLWQQGQHPLEPEDVQQLAPDPACDLRAAPCRLDLPGGGTVALSVSPRALPPMAPLNLEAVISDSGLSAVWVAFVGVEMDMGFNRARLEDAGGGRFTGTGLIPVCVTDRMLWEARVLMTDGDAWLSAPFRFEVVRE